MIYRVVIRIATAISLLISLVLGQPAVAMSSDAPAVGIERMDMSGNMDCCAKKQTDKRDTKCPLTALCSTPIAMGPCGLLLPSLFAEIYRREAPDDAPAIRGRTSLPVPKPPRSSI